MDIDEKATRLRAARKALKLNQTDFAAAFGMSQGGYARVETGANAMSDRVLKSACQAHNISERWLRTGEGDMFVDDTEALLGRLRDEMGMSETEVELLQTFLSFPSAEREQVIAFGKRFAARFAHDGEQSDDDIERASQTDIKRKIVLAELDDEDKASEK